MPNPEIKSGPESRGHLEILQVIAQQTSTASNLEEVLKSIITGALEIIGSDSGLILLWNELGDELELGAVVNLSKLELSAFADYHNISRYSGLMETARTGNTSIEYAADAVAADNRLQDRLPPGIGTMAGTALKLGNQILGVLVLQSADRSSINTDNLTTLELVCSFVGFQIQAAKQSAMQLAIEEELLKGEQYLECLAGITSQLLADPYPDSLLTAVIDRLRKVTGVCRCYYATIESDRAGDKLVHLKHEATAASIAQLHQDNTSQVVALAQSGLANSTAELAAGNQIHGEIAAFAGLDNRFPHTPDCKWLLVLPVIVHRELVAVIGFDVTRPGVALGEHEISLLRGVANSISSALERNEAERELVAAHDHLENILQSSTGHAIIATDLSFTVLHYNSVAQEMFGYPSREAIGNNLLETAVFAGRDTPEIEQLTDSVINEGIWEQDVEMPSKAGETRIVSVVVSGMVGNDGVLYGYTVFCRDVTDLRMNERQLVERQRMESIGLLAGGIAHDFNNILMGILGYASLAKDRVGEEHAAHRMVSIIEKSAERAAALTRELLAYARGGKSQSMAVRIDEQVAEILAIVSTNLPKGVEIVKQFDPGVPLIMADPAQLQQVIMNLCINAGDAISLKAVESESGEYTGRIVLRTSICKVSNRERHKLGLQDNPPGLQYVCLEVEDSGIGMDLATIERIFEPFFTTKISGRGLGLSAVDGIIRNHGGCLNVDSTPGSGSKFTILLPADPSIKQPEAEEIELIVPRGSETILVVDDEDVNRQLALLTLTNVGYEVLLAKNGKEGLGVYAENSEKISLVLLDLTMPGLSVEAVLSRFAEYDPPVPVILTSGFDLSRIREIKGTDTAAGFLQKPYAPDALARAVRKILDGSKASQASQA